MKSLYKVDETLENIAKSSETKILASPGRLIFAGFSAGAFIAFGFLFGVVASSSFHPEFNGNVSTFKLLLGAVFPVGLIAVVIAGAELWTGNVKSAYAVKLSRKAGFAHVLYNWVGSYGGNFIGSLFIALIAVHSHILEGEFGEVVTYLAQSKVSKDVGALILLGIGCNWLVNLAIWQSLRIEGAGKILAIWFPIFAFVTIGFEHSIANMWLISAAIFLNDYSISWSDFFYNITFVTLGNAIGGFVFVAFYYWYLGNPELKINEIVQELKDFSLVFTFFWFLAVIVPACLSIIFNSLLNELSLYLSPLTISIYFVFLTFLISKSLLPAIPHSSQ